MEYKKMDSGDAAFLTQVFSTPEYELFFAENLTTADEWANRMEGFKDMESFLILNKAKPIGWIMYSLVESVCLLDILVLLPSEREKGYGSIVMHDLILNNPAIREIKLDVQKRNENAYEFYRKLGFEIISSETQPVGNGYQEYFKMRKEI